MAVFCKISLLTMSLLVSESYWQIPSVKTGIQVRRIVSAKNCGFGIQSFKLPPNGLTPTSGCNWLKRATVAQLPRPTVRAECCRLRSSISNVQNISDNPETPPSKSLSALPSSDLNSAPERVVLSLLRLKPLSPGKALPSIGFKAEYLFFNQPKEGEEWSMGDEWVMPWENIQSGESVEQAIQRTLNKVCASCNSC